MNIKSPEYWRNDIQTFETKTAEFCAGEIDKAAYKGVSGKFGSYSQRSGTEHMLRLRMASGCVTMDRLKFVADTIRKYNIKRVHFTTCQTIQLHDLEPSVIAQIIEEALEVGIVTLGGGGDYPRNVMCSPLSGVEKDEYFDVKPWADAAGDYLLSFINAEKMPRKLKVGFSNSPKNLTHVTYRDLGFAAREDGTFDVYSAGGLGKGPMFGVKVDEAVEPRNILYYVKAMRLNFIENGNYQSRAKSRSRFMQETLGGADEYAAAFKNKLEQVMSDGEDLTIQVPRGEIKKQGDGTTVCHNRAMEQKQSGLYSVAWHPFGGQPTPESICELYELIKDMDSVELRLAPDETAYIINLTGAEAEKVIEATKGGGENEFEMSVSCIGASICQIGLRDSQALLNACIEKVREEQIPSGALPQIHISGCPSSCGTHQTGALGFRGAAKMIDKKPHSAYALFVNGNERQGRERMGEELGVILEEQIPDFLVELGKAVAESGSDYYTWNSKDENAVKAIADKYIVK